MPIWLHQIDGQFTLQKIDTPKRLLELAELQSIRLVSQGSNLDWYNIN
jgi:hypothetical protein